MLTRSASFKSSIRPMIGGNSMPSTPISGINSSILLSSMSSSSTTATRNSTQRLTPNEVKAVHYVMRLLHKNGRILLQSVPGLIARAPDHLAQLIGFTRDDLVLFFKRHNAVFQLHTDGTVSVKSDAVRTLLNKNDTNNNNNNNFQTSLSSTQSSNSITTSGVVIRIFPKYGILNMDNNFETFSDLTCVVNPGDSMNFNAILGPKEGRFQLYENDRIDFTYNSENNYPISCFVFWLFKSTRMNSEATMVCRLLYVTLGSESHTVMLLV
jgi:hypothetical protein